MGRLHRWIEPNSYRQAVGVDVERQEPHDGTWGTPGSPEQATGGGWGTGEWSGQKRTQQRVNHNTVWREHNSGVSNRCNGEGLADLVKLVPNVAEYAACADERRC